MVDLLCPTSMLSVGLVGPSSQNYMDLGELADKQQQTLMWQHNQYMGGDSGIHSGTTTQVCVCGVLILQLLFVVKIIS